MNFRTARESLLDGLHTARKGLGQVNDVAERFENHQTLGSIAGALTGLVAGATDLIDGVENDLLNPAPEPESDADMRRRVVSEYYNGIYGYDLGWADKTRAPDARVEGRYNSLKAEGNI